MRWTIMAAALVLAGCAAESSSGSGGLRGERGPQGPQGAQGPQGPKGAPGPAGGGDGSKSGSRLTYLGTTLRGSDGSVFVQPGGFFDEDLGVECTPAMAPDGRMRCLPLGTWFSAAFADADCTEPAALVLLSDDCAAPAFVGASTPVECGGVPNFTLHRTLEELTAAFTRTGGDCRPSTLAEFRSFRIGEAMPPTSFVAFE